MKKLVAGLFVLLLSFPTAMVSAETEENSNVISQAKAEQTALSYITQHPKFQKGEVLPATKLHDFDGNLTAYLHPVQYDKKESGYVITSAIKEIPVVLEAAASGSHPFKDIKKGSEIYVGPGMYYSKLDKESYSDIKLKNTFKKGDLKYKGPLSKDELVKIQLSTPEQPPVSLNFPSMGPQVIAGVPDYLNDKGLGCYPTAAATLVSYWDNNKSGYSNLVSTGTTETALITELNTLMNTQNGATSGSDARAGLDTYFSNKGYSSVNVEFRLGSQKTYQNYVNEIINNRPILLGWDGQPYGNHAITGVGFYWWTDHNQQRHESMIVHDNWETTPKEVYYTWLSGVTTMMVTY